MKVIYLLSFLVSSADVRAWSVEAPAASTPPTAKSTTSATELFPDTAVAKGKGFEIKRSQLDDAVTSIKATAEAQGRSIPEAQMVQMEQQVLDRLIQIQLLLAKATEADKAKGLETATKRFENVKTRAGTEEVLNRQLKSVGLSQEQLRSKMLEEASAEAVLERELKVNVTDEEVKKFYDENPARFERPEKVSEKIQAKKVEMAKVSQDIKDYLKGQAVQKQLPDYMKKARKDADVQILDEKLKPDQAATATAPAVPPPGTQSIDPTKLTKAEWRKAVAPFDVNSRHWSQHLLSGAGFKARFGKPVKEQRVGDSAYWYYRCSDGEIQVVIKADFLEQQGVVIESINEF